MDPRNKKSIIRSCEKIHNTYALKPGATAVDSTISKHVEDPIRLPESYSSKTKAQSNCYRTYRYEQCFGRTIETYPIFLEFILKKTTVEESSTDHNKIGEQDIVLLENYKTVNNEHSTDVKPSPLSSSSSSNPKSSASSSHTSLDLKPSTENITPKECPIPCVRELLCPKYPPCPEQPEGGSSGLGGFGGTGGNPLHDPDNVQLQCSTRNIKFKLKCSKLPPGCDHPEGTYECEIVDEGQYVDSKDLEACDLKCKEINAIHSGHDIIIEEDTQGPIVVKKLDYKKEQNELPEKITTMMCLKNGVNFSLKGTRKTSGPDCPSDIICNIEEQKISSSEICSTPREGKQRCNIIYDSILDNVDSNDNTQLFTNKQHSIAPSDDKDECIPYLFEDKENKQECYNYVEQDAPEFPTCHKMNNINVKNNIYSCLSKLNIHNVEHKCNHHKPNDSADFMCPGENEDRSTIIEKLQSSFIENHNRTMKILKMATNDLLCKITKNEKCTPCWKTRHDDNKLECLNAATESFHKLVDTVCETTKTISKLTRETIDGYIGSEEKCEPAEPPDCKLRKTSGKPLPEDFITMIKDSSKQIINGVTNKDIFEDEQLQPNGKPETIINSATKIYNKIKEITQEEFDTVKTMNSLKETCVNLIDKTSKILSDDTIDRPKENEPSTVQGFIKEMMNGITVFQDEDKTKPNPDENFFAHSVYSSLSKSFQEDNNTDQQTIYHSEIEESFTLGSIFTTLKDKICSIFHDNQNEITYSGHSNTSSSAFSEQINDDHMK